MENDLKITHILKLTGKNVKTTMIHTLKKAQDYLDIMNKEIRKFRTSIKNVRKRQFDGNP